MAVMTFLVFLSTFCCLITKLVFADVVLVDKYNQNVLLSLTSVPATFVPIGSEKVGILFSAWPLDACSPLINSSSIEYAYSVKYSPFVLIVDGGCSYVDKVRRAQDAGFEAAIVYNEHDTMFVPMPGNSTGIQIPSVTVSYKSGLTLGKYVGRNDIEVWLTQSNDMSTWFPVAILFVSVVFLSVSLVLAYRSEQRRQISPRGSRVRKFQGMCSRLVNAMPSSIFTEPLEDDCTSATCAICLDDYNVGDKIRILPCHHKFHASCIDAWLTSWKTFCPVCKRDVNSSISDSPAMEHTPLLSSSTTNNHQSNASSLHMFHAFFNPFAWPSLSPLHSIYMPFFLSRGNASVNYIRSSSQHHNNFTSEC